MICERCKSYPEKMAGVTTYYGTTYFHKCKCGSYAQYRHVDTNEVKTYYIHLFGDPQYYLWATSLDGGQTIVHELVDNVHEPIFLVKYYYDCDSILNCREFIERLSKLKVFT